MAGVVLDRLTDKAIRTLLRIAKQPGARPFFRDPRAMIALREEARRREDRAWWKKQVK